MNKWLDRNGAVQEDEYLRHQLLATENYRIVRQYKHNSWVRKMLALVWRGVAIDTQQPNYEIVWINEESKTETVEPSCLSREVTETSAIAIFEDYLVRNQLAEYFQREDKGDEPVLFLTDNAIDFVPHQAVGNAQMERLTDPRFGAW